MNEVEFEEGPAASGAVLSCCPVKLRVITEREVVTFRRGQSWDRSGRYRLRRPYRGAKVEVDVSSAIA